MSRRKEGKKDEGFTLIELVVVVIIIAILAGALVPSVVGKVSSAKEARNKSDLDAIATAERMYYMDNNQWTSDWSELEPYGIPQQPTDPWENEYQLNINETGELVISSDSEDAEKLTVPKP